MSLILRSSWQTRFIAVFTLSLLFVVSTTISAFASAAAPVSLTQLSSDPYLHNPGQHKTEVEPDSYSVGSTIVSAFQVGRSSNGGSDNTGWATSTDSGRTWTNGFLPGTTTSSTPPGPYARMSDPSVAYDAAHNTWMITSLALTVSFSPAILVNLSSNGTSWSTPLTVVNAPKAYLDKEWIGCDDTASSKFYGHCYVEWDINSSNNLIQMSTSTDGGKTWSTPQTTADNASGTGGQPLVQPDGTVIVPISNSAFTEILSFISTDGGASWSKTYLAASTPFYTEQAHIRTGFQYASLDASGKVYVVWSGCSFESSCTANDLILSTSTDGISWSAPRLIPVDPIGSGIDHIIPGLTVDKGTSGPTAHLALVYYYLPVASCTTKACLLDVGYVSSTDGGVSWSGAQQLAGPMQLPWLADTGSGYMVGDYVSIAITGGRAFPAIPVATAPKGGLLNENMYTVTGGLAVE